MNLIRIFGLVFFAVLISGSPFPRPDAYTKDDSRLLAKRGHHHHRPAFHDDVDSKWNYDSEVGVEVIDLTGLDPCENISCQPHTICVVQRRDEALCINKEDIFGYAGINSSPDHCVSCEEDPSDVRVCGSSGQTYRSACVLRYHACLKNVDLQVICAGECPCPIDLIKQAAEGDLISVQVTKLLGPPSNLTAESMNDDRTSARVNLTWKPPAGFESPYGIQTITEYIIHYSAEGMSGWETVPTPGAVTSLSITGLQSNTLYYFRIQAVMGQGSAATVLGPLSDAIFHRTISVQDEEAGTVDGEEGDIVDDQDASGDHDIEDDREG